MSADAVARRDEAPAPAGRPSEYLSAYRVDPKLALRVWQRELTLYKRIWPSTILSTLFDPILYLLAIGFALGQYVSGVGEGTYAQFIAPGMVATAVMHGAAYEAAWNSYVRIFVERSYEAMMSTPAALEDVLAGEVLWAASRAVASSTIVLLVVTAFGLVSSPWAALIPLVAVVGGVMFTTLGLCYTVGREHMDQLTFMFTLGITPMFLFSGVFFPLSGLPAWAQALAWASPLFHLVEVVRGLATGVPGPWMLGHVAWMLALTALAWGYPARVLRRRIRA
ncbi:MAG TPA: ABC transporter permease [Candidatus Thermoplasmatota archaeon]|nr:ABC transporter permease [Candidatus Thermoplasmatota archaeon]